MYLFGRKVYHSTCRKRHDPYLWHTYWTQVCCNSSLLIDVFQCYITWCRYQSVIFFFVIDIQTTSLTDCQLRILCYRGSGMRSCVAKRQSNNTVSWRSKSTLNISSCQHFKHSLHDRNKTYVPKYYFDIRSLYVVTWYDATIIHVRNNVTWMPRNSLCFLNISFHIILMYLWMYTCMCTLTQTTAF